MTQDLIKSIRQSIGSGKQRFESIVLKDGSDLNWPAETLFAMQVIEKSKYLQGCSLSSLKNAVINIASIGLTLNPAEKLAYLIPRKRKYQDGNGKWVEIWEACLDISYRGLVKIATDAGSIRWAKSMLVLEGEEFIWKGVDVKPVHNITNPFGRKECEDEMLGGYSIAKTSDGDYLCEMMTAEDIIKIRDRSDAWKFGKKGKKGPWESDFGQMAKKTLIRRGSVSWPTSDRFMHAEGLLNVHQGTTFDKTVVEPDDTQELLVDGKQVAQLEKLVKESKIDVKRIYKAFNIPQLSDLPASKFDDCKSRLEAALAAHKTKEGSDVK